MRKGASKSRHFFASGNFLLFLSKCDLLGVPQDPKSIPESNWENLQQWLQDVRRLWPMSSYTSTSGGDVSPLLRFPLPAT